MMTVENAITQTLLLLEPEGEGGTDLAQFGWSTRVTDAIEVLKLAARWTLEPRVVRDLLHAAHRLLVEEVRDFWSATIQHDEAGRVIQAMGILRRGMSS